MGAAGFGAAGFGLVECLLAAGILSVALLGLAALELATARAQGLARNRSAALGLATGALERSSAGVRAGGAGFQSPDGSPADPLGWECACGRDGRWGPAVAPFFRVRVDATPGPDGTLRLRAAVTWEEGRGRALALERLLHP
jgi:hypothetical protein